VCNIPERFKRHTFCQCELDLRLALFLGRLLLQLSTYARCAVPMYAFGPQHTLMLIGTRPEVGLVKAGPHQIIRVLLLRVMLSCEEDLRPDLRVAIIAICPQKTGKGMFSKFTQ